MDFTFLLMFVSLTIIGIVAYIHLRKEFTLFKEMEYQKKILQSMKDQAQKNSYS